MNGQIVVLQTSLIGVILSSMHLMLGLGFLFGGFTWTEQSYDKGTAQMFGTMLLLSISSLIIPTVAKLLVGVGDLAELPISRNISVVLLCIYAIFIYFQLVTHADLFSHPGTKASKRWRRSLAKGAGHRLAAIGYAASGIAGEPAQSIKYTSLEGADATNIRDPLKFCRKIFQKRKL